MARLIKIGVANTLFECERLAGELRDKGIPTFIQEALAGHGGGPDIVALQVAESLLTPRNCALIRAILGNHADDITLSKYERRNSRSSDG